MLDCNYGTLLTSYFSKNTKISNSSNPCVAYHLGRGSATKSGEGVVTPFPTCSDCAIRPHSSNLNDTCFYELLDHDVGKPGASGACPVPASHAAAPTWTMLANCRRTPNVRACYGYVPARQHAEVICSFTGSGTVSPPIAQASSRHYSMTYRTTAGAAINETSWKGAYRSRSGRI